MHSVTYRTNAVLTMGVTGLLVLCAAIATTDVFHRSKPEANLRIHDTHYFQPLGKNDEAVLSFNLQGDLSSCFSWNTKQLFAYIKIVYETKKHKRNEVTVWDKIISSKEAAKDIEEIFLSKYRLVDNGRDLRGRDVNITLAWNVMPYIGALYFEELTFSGTLPSEYIRGEAMSS